MYGVETSWSSSGNVHSERVPGKGAAKRLADFSAVGSNDRRARRTNSTTSKRDAERESERKEREKQAERDRETERQRNR